MKMGQKIERFIGLTLGVNPVFAFMSLMYLSICRVKGIGEKIRSERAGLWFAGLLAISGMISVFLAVDHSTAIGSFFIPFAFMWMYVLGRWTIRNPHQFVQDLIRGVTCLAVIAIIAKTFHLTWSIGDVRILSEFRWDFERGEILYVADNSLGLLFQLGVIGAFGSLLIYWKEKRYLVENILAFAICSGGLMISGSRGAMMAVLLAMGYFVVHFNQKAIPGVVGVMGIVGVFAGERFLSTFKMAEHAVRIKIWSTSWNIIKDHLFFGVGPGNFGKVFDAYRPASFTREVTCAHSNYLNIIIGWGIIGGLLFWGWQAFVLIRAAIRKLTPLQKVVMAILLGFYAHVMINELFTPYAGFLLGLLDHPSFQKTSSSISETIVPC